MQNQSAGNASQSQLVRSPPHSGTYFKILHSYSECCCKNCLGDANLVHKRHELSTLNCADKNRHKQPHYVFRTTLGQDHLLLSPPPPPDKTNMVCWVYSNATTNSPTPRLLLGGFHADRNKDRERSTHLRIGNG